MHVHRGCELVPQPLGQLCPAGRRTLPSSIPASLRVDPAGTIHKNNTCAWQLGDGRDQLRERNAGHCFSSLPCDTIAPPSPQAQNGNSLGFGILVTWLCLIILATALDHGRRNNRYGRAWCGWSRRHRWVEELHWWERGVCCRKHENVQNRCRVCRWCPYGVKSHFYRLPSRGPLPIHFKNHLEWKHILLEAISNTLILEIFLNILRISLEYTFIWFFNNLCYFKKIIIFTLIFFLRPYIFFLLVF
jgi:hypothetical protein